MTHRLRFQTLDLVRRGAGEGEFGLGGFSVVSVGGSEQVVDGGTAVGLGSAADVLANLFAEQALERFGELAGDGVVGLEEPVVVVLALLVAGDIVRGEDLFTFVYGHAVALIA